VESVAPVADERTADADDPAPDVQRRVWHEPLQTALLGGRLTPAQHDAIRQGLGEPALRDDIAPEAVAEAWSIAATDLIAEAGLLPVEELRKRARIVRDLLDPTGAEDRFWQRFQRRSFRMWVDADGQHHGHLVFDDEAALWVRSMVDAAMRPRRGGVRFVTDDERQEADDLVTDPRSNEQLEYDLVLDVLRSGSLATAPEVFGARQPGVRLVLVQDAEAAPAPGSRDPLGRLLAVGHAEDGGDAVPGSVMDRALCETGSRRITVDGCGNPLNAGRERRLFSAAQRLVLAARDGGCMWPGCVRPASYCEAHHIDHYAEDGGATDVDRGCLLCRFHHLLLHNRGWKIRRRGKGPFVLHPPPDQGAPIVLVSKAPWKWAWDPPPPPGRATWRAAAAVRPQDAVASTAAASR
jgi:hypothetical protein